MDKITNQLTLVTVQDGKDGIDGDGSAAGVYSGTCETDAAITSKKVVLDRAVEPINGLQIAVLFTHNNTANNPYIELQYNNTSIGKGYPIYAGERILTSPDIYEWKANQLVSFIFFDEKWYITSASAANAMKFEDGKLQIYNTNKSNGFKAELGDRFLDFKIGQDNLAHYGVDGVELYNAAGGETNALKGQPYAQFGSTTILGYNQDNEPHLTAQRNYLAMNDSSGEYFRVSRKGLMYKATIDQNNNQWLGISPDGKIGIVNNYEDIINDKDNMTVDSTIKVGGKNLLLQSNNYNNFYSNIINSLIVEKKSDIWLNNDAAVFVINTYDIGNDSDTVKIYWNNDNQDNKGILLIDTNYIISYDLLFKKEKNSEEDTIIDGSQYTKNKENGENFFNITAAITDSNNNITYYNIISQKNFIETTLEDSLGNSYLHHECHFTINNKDSNNNIIDIKNCRYYLSVAIPKNDKEERIKVYVTNLKLETGNIPTNWEPSPNDSKTNIESIAAALGIIKIVDQDTISQYKGSIGFDNEKEAFITNFIASNMLQTDAIYSSNIERNQETNEVKTENGFLTQGTLLDLGSGELNSKNFRIAADGDAYFNGTITATAGNIGGFNIDHNILKSEKVGISGRASLYNADKMLWAGAIEDNNKISDANFYVTNDGFMKSTSGQIGGIVISSEGLRSSSENGFSLLNNGKFALGDKLTYDANEGKLNIKQGVISLSSFIVDEQNQLNKTKYITIGKDNSIILSDVNENNESVGSRLIITSTGLELLDSEEGNKINISSSDGIIIGNTNNNNINITKSQIQINTVDSGSIDISGSSIDFKNKNGNDIILSISTDTDNANIKLGNKNINNSTFIELSSSDFTLGKVDNNKNSSQLFTISDSGFILNEKTVPTTAGNHFAIGDNFCYDSNRGLAIAENAFDLLWPKDGNAWVETESWLKEDDGKTTKIAWEKNLDNPNANAVNILKTEHGIGFFEGTQVDDPIAYFSNNKLYVKRTQVVNEQEISGFRWFVRNGSEYVAEEGKALHNLGLKWIG